MRSMKTLRGSVRSVSLEEIEKDGFVLTPGRYVGTGYTDEDDEVFSLKISRLMNELEILEKSEFGSLE